MNFNINNYVKVKLSEHGKQIITERYAECGINDYEIKVDDDGFTEFQLHDLMYTYGKYMHSGTVKLPFDVNIVIDKKYLKEGDE